MKQVDGVRLVLVEPQFAGNVGACARVAANFGVGDVVLVNPECDHLSREAKLYAKGPAASVLARFRVAGSIESALKGCFSSVGFTRRTGELRRSNLTPSGVAELCRSQEKTALVFGREDRGLGKSELLACTHVCSFETSETMPSLNLSHAVAVALARVYEGGARGRSAARAESVPSEELEALFSHWRATMVDAGMVKAGNPERMLAHFRRMLQRAELGKRDVALFRAFLSKTQVAMGTRKRKRG